MTKFPAWKIDGIVNPIPSLIALFMLREAKNQPLFGWGQVRNDKSHKYREMAYPHPPKRNLETVKTMGDDKHRPYMVSALMRKEIVSM